MVATLTVKRDTYKMMIYGTFVMAFPTFILALGQHLHCFAYLTLMTIGEAMWRKILQWVAEIAPRYDRNLYGSGQVSWFLTTKL
ncbi:MAG: hypothetical protein IPI19_10970 [Ignavibacteriales bacterium]|nr:hypothetical protein [Ignavibacteriales bacterium]